jgi:hypothetical protein
MEAAAREADQRLADAERRLADRQRAHNLLLSDLQVQRAESEALAASNSDISRRWAVGSSGVLAGSVAELHAGLLVVPGACGTASAGML